MNKTILVSIAVSVFCYTDGNAQYTHTSVSQQAYMDAQFLKGTIRVRGNEKTEEAQGSPYLNPDWGKATVYYTNGKAFNEVEIQYNLLNNELYFRKAEEIFLFTDTVKSFDLMYTIGEKIKNERFQSGYPPIDNQKESHFYQVLATGPKLQLLKYRYVKRNESYHYSEGKKINYFEYEDLYLFDVQSSKIVRIKKGDSHIPELLPALEQQMNTIIKSQGLKLKNMDDLTRLVGLVNQ